MEYNAKFRTGVLLFFGVLFGTLLILSMMRGEVIAATAISLGYGFMVGVFTADYIITKNMAKELDMTPGMHHLDYLNLIKSKG